MGIIPRSNPILGSYNEPFPTDINLRSLIYEKDGERIEVEFGHIRDRLYEQNALSFSS
jgi:hypothetical protein